MTGVTALVTFVASLSALGRKRRAEQLEVVTVDWYQGFGHVFLYDGTELQVVVCDDNTGKGARFVSV